MTDFQSLCWSCNFLTHEKFGRRHISNDGKNLDDSQVEIIKRRQQTFGEDAIDKRAVQSIQR